MSLRFFMGGGRLIGMGVAWMTRSTLLVRLDDVLLVVVVHT